VVVVFPEALNLEHITTGAARMRQIDHENYGWIVGPTI
jgi:hypothetical protein